MDDGQPILATPGGLLIPPVDSHKSSRVEWYCGAIRFRIQLLLELGAAQSGLNRPLADRSGFWNSLQRDSFDLPRHRLNLDMGAGLSNWGKRFLRDLFRSSAPEAQPSCLGYSNQRMNRITLGLFALILSVIGHSDEGPKLTMSQASRIAQVIKRHEKIEGRIPSKPHFDKADGTWTVLASMGFPGSDTFIIIRDLDGAYMTFSSSSRKTPKFRISPRIRREIRLIRDDPNPKN